MGPGEVGDVGEGRRVGARVGANGGNAGTNATGHANEGESSKRHILLPQILPRPSGHAFSNGGQDITVMR
ncbi:hypothetical protein D9758_016593 [Tetrapyrgos nigripes]|uniref:Uncharacterized protein n=1 Tax=Tetrapyrgos nigripes TaxID=182062 RepID=A0A8H5CFJ0_9AGAR|nr:hypothetical protein D9758_016593 [Tetrapyrgos nigripes]